jgi:DNA-directed RNA polymerase subunit K/omega
MRSDSSRSTSDSFIGRRPDGMGKFQFVVLSALRAAQLKRGCTARIDGDHKATVTAQFEVAAGKVPQIEG